MDFINKKSLDDLIRTAQVEVLLASVMVDTAGPVIYPTKCPAVGRKADYLTDTSKEAVCFFKNKQCKYFTSAKFSLEDYTKIIICDAVNVEDVRD